MTAARINGRAAREVLQELVEAQDDFFDAQDRYAHSNGEAEGLEALFDQAERRLKLAWEEARRVVTDVTRAYTKRRSER